jgi:hypothetical protein
MYHADRHIINLNLWLKEFDFLESVVKKKSINF